VLALAYLAVVRSRLPGAQAPCTPEGVDGDLKGGPPWQSSWLSTLT
jgi:hypothetical protein